MSTIAAVPPIMDIDLADPEFLACPWPTLMRLQQQEAIFWSERNQSWIVTRHADVRAGYADRRLSSSGGLARILRVLPEEGKERAATALKFIALTVNRLDGRDHMRVRTLMMKAFTPGAVRALQPLIQGLVDRLLDEIGEGGELNFSERISAMLPPLVIQHMLGVPESERENLFRLVADFTATTAAANLNAELIYKLDETIRVMNGIFNELVAEREKQPRDDLISKLVHARDGEARLNHDELLACFHAIIVAGAESTAHTLATQIVQLCARPDLQEVVRGDHQAAYQVVTELLRYPGTVKSMPRIAAEDFVWHDKQIRKGDIIWLMNFGANVDPSVFENPLTIDHLRDNRDSMAFGPGLHHCIGHMLSRIELSTFFASAFDRFDISIPEQTLEYVPSSIFYAYRSLRVRFEPRA